MKRVNKISLTWLFIIILPLITASIYLGYRYGYKKGLEIGIKKDKYLTRLQKQPEKEAKQKSIKEEIEKRQRIKTKLNCEEARQNILDFLSYLNQKKYIQKYCKEDIKQKIKSIIKNLSKNPPLPIGEAARNDIMIKNIYHFFRVLSIDDLQLIKAILKNESDELEYIMKWYYTWFTHKEKCPDQYGLLPSMDVAYKYASFFLNTIGGRAYLSRRSNQIKLLVTYYSILIIHSMNKEGKNRFGIDIYPIICTLKSELTEYSKLKFQIDYITTLNDLEKYYSQKRKL